MEAQLLNKPTITKEWLAARIQQNPSCIIGKALTILAHSNSFKFHDQRIGHIGARQYSNSNKLQPWCIEAWSKLQRDGFPRLCRYADQLQAITLAKKSELNCTANVVLI